MFLQYNKKCPLSQCNLKTIHISLRCKRGVALIAVIPALDVHVIDHPDAEEIQVLHTDPQLYTPQEEERRRHLPVGRALFFLAETSVCTLRPQSSMICGSTW